MSKRKRAGSDTPAGESTEFGKRLSELFDPRYQAFMQMEASDSDVRDFLEASRQLFAYKPDTNVKLLKMPIDTQTAGRYVDTLFNKIDEIEREGNPANDPVQAHRLELAHLIKEGLTRIASKAILMDWTKKIWAQANKRVRATRSRDGGIRFESATPKKKHWARTAIEQVRQKEPNISISDLAERLHAMARKERPDWWKNPGSVRRWLYQHEFL